MSDDNRLGVYLRARRELVRPEDVGLRTTGVRRVPGLRREEVALLAGVSADYYLRLEQGRDRNPSPQVLEALAQVLQLDEAATTYLLGLVAPRPRSARRRRRAQVPPALAQLVDVMGVPAVVEDRYLDVVAANTLGQQLDPSLTPGENRLRSFFLDPAMQALHDDWEGLCETLVAAFRTSVGSETDDPRAVEIVGELSLASERFRRLWARHDVKALAGSAMILDHPQVGLLTVFRHKFPLSDGSGLILGTYHAEPGTESAEKLALLGSLSSTEAARLNQR
ncbi:transcriptional regulator with XRE-family HTH domain [Nocardioides luteus]|uniref:Transcriptional regulator n=1 Tax=Nocardioides luteus TaxID=1844 RepID=A0ABQ5SWG9_9ACTN|nr:helix-turn-helix transcriptional regulator [Nocardioides luteus]MDR7312269.1 transcriptional regulator with XRE-family HTH domain [Nocardioides luteus]GGR57127.1 transcriptional regulator [Nocardioides luteus]GLJ68515.1 transcriptional regulator [Nocardioides luteus]